MIPISRPWLGEEEAAATRRVILSGWITQGPEVAAFEKEFADFVGTTHACAVSNCTVALQLALQAVGVGVGDEVITVSHSFIATANSIKNCGATPVFADIRSDQTFNIDPDAIAPLITSKTRAILVVHQLGMPCDLRGVMKVARERGLRVIEDAACAIGSQIQLDGSWAQIGAPVADVACFSFHPRKLLSTGDGGMLTTRDPELDRRFRLLRQHGMSVSDLNRHAATAVVFESYLEVGFNYRMTDIQAAVGREQLKKVPAMVKERRARAQIYSELLSAAPQFRVPHEPNWARSNWQSYCVGLPPGADQRHVMQVALDRGISLRRGVMCAHREPAYQPKGGGSQSLKNSEVAQDRSVILPLFHGITDAEQELVVRTIREACQ